MPEKDSIVIDGIKIFGWPVNIVRRVEKVEELYRTKLADYELRIATMEEIINKMREEVNLI